MGTLRLHDLSTPKEEIIKEREQRFLIISSADKFYALLHLNKVAVKMNSGQPLKGHREKELSFPSLYNSLLSHMRATAYDLETPDCCWVIP